VNLDQSEAQNRLFNFDCFFHFFHINTLLNDRLLLSFLARTFSFASRRLAALFVLFCGGLNQSNVRNNLLLQCHLQKLVKARVRVIRDLSRILAFSKRLGRRDFFSFVEHELRGGGRGYFVRWLFLNSEVVVVEDLNRDLELVKFCLHQLLGLKCEELLAVLTLTRLHDLLAFLDILFLAVFNDLPELVAEHVTALVQFLLGLGVFPKVGEVVAESVKVLDELVKKLLLVVKAVNEFQEVLLSKALLFEGLLTVSAHIPENLPHLTPVVVAELLPQSDQSGSEFRLNIVPTESRHPSRAFQRLLDLACASG